jgi:hypothetical protein
MLTFKQMDINKVSWNNSEKKVNLAFPIAKVNKEKRTVSGFATLDNIDRHGDIVTPEASEKAFTRFRGNLREMHQPIAVGKVLSFSPKKFLDPETNKSYQGVYVDAYISKGAQDTWEKVLDGTLTGFSIGGNIVEASYEPGDSKDDTRVIKDYELMELSLVDNPANPLANIFSIQKSTDGLTLKGMAVDTQIENVFWCNTDLIATTSTGTSSDCISCGESMSNVGWVEKSDIEKNVSIKKVIDAYFKKDDAPGPTHAATTRDADAGTNADGAITSEDTINRYPDQNKIKKSEISTGDFVTWGSSGGSAHGKVIKIIKNGSYKVPNSSFTIKGSAEDPAAAIRVYKKKEKVFVPTDTVVGHKISTLSKVNVKLSKSVQNNTFSKGGNKEMADELNEDFSEELVETPSEIEVVEEFAAVDSELVDGVEKAATVSELPVDELDFAKMVDTLKSEITETIKKNYADATSTAQDVQKSVDDFNSNIQKSIDDFGSKVSELSNNVAEVTKMVNDLQKRVDAYEGATAVKKSGDVVTSSDENKITKSIWQGHFLGVSNI